MESAVAQAVVHLTAVWLDPGSIPDYVEEFFSVQLLALLGLPSLNGYWS